MEILKSAFDDTMRREGRKIYDNKGKAYTVFSRQIKDTKTSENWLSVYCANDSPLCAGVVLDIDGLNYLVVGKNGANSAVYRRYDAVMCNQKIILAKKEKGLTPDEFGKYPDVLKIYATTDAFLATELSSVSKYFYGTALGGKLYATLPAFSIYLNTVVLIKKFDQSGTLENAEYIIESIDMTECRNTANKLNGIIRLQLKFPT